MVVDNQKVRFYGNTAIITGQIIYGGTRRINHTQVWAKRQGRWQIVSWQGTQISNLAITSEENGMVTTASGLKYLDRTVGTGEAPTAGQQVTVHYTGTLEDGTKFDSSLDRGEPFTFVIGTGRVIRGWDEGVITMKVGGKRKLIIPSHLGYGPRGAGGGVIPPHPLEVHRAGAEVHEGEGADEQPQQREPLGGRLGEEAAVEPVEEPPHRAPTLQVAWSFESTGVSCPSKNATASKVSVRISTLTTSA
jgi:peptidylprolyl isomerase